MGNMIGDSFSCDADQMLDNQTRIFRYKTAIKRTELSKPLRVAIEDISGMWLTPFVCFLPPPSAP